MAAVEEGMQNEAWRIEYVREKREKAERGIIPQGIREGYTLCKMKNGRRAEWIMLRKGDTEVLHLAAMSVWGCREFRVIHPD
jgi:hypothetical protein